VASTPASDIFRGNAGSVLMDSVAKRRSWETWLIAICACVPLVFSSPSLASDSRLPSSGREIYSRAPDAWQEYRWQIFLIGAVILMQGALISALLFDRHHRQFAELQLRQRLAELARSSRYSLAAELAATIAHEINQPLGAILANSEMLETMLHSPAPDLLELREIAADIRRDDQRAADVIRHLQNPLKKLTLKFRDVDLNDPVRDATHFFLALAVARNANVSSSIAPTPLPVKGSVVQLHQCILSLIVNAMDAMSDLPVDQRKLAIATARGKFCGGFRFRQGTGRPA
jgi:signal transduction histidine kinase